MADFFRKHTLIFGTLFLTGAGFLSRILGFFYRIFLSRTIGAEGLGIYQMIFPIYGICFSLCAGSIQTALSRLIASRPKRTKETFTVGLFIACSFSLLLAVLIRNGSDFIAIHILREPRCAPLLPTLALAIPFTALHACICGYYYGKEKVRIPAIAQLVEQCIRIAAVFLIADIWTSQERELTALIAVFGLAAGEAGSAMFALAVFLISSGNFPKSFAEPSSDSASMYGSFVESAKPLLTMAAPLMANRLVMNLLQSLEAIMIPNRLESFGMTGSQALSIYGVLTGMAMPFILFPSAIVHSLAVILLPTIARQQADRNHLGILKNLTISFRSILAMGILCVGVFTVFGKELGNLVFHDSDAGTFITILAWLCPFLYLAAAMGSVLNGLGHTTLTFLHNIASLLLRLAFVFFGIPLFGIHAVLWGMLASEILLVLLHMYSLNRLVSFSPNMRDIMATPILCLILAIGIYSLFPETFCFGIPIPPFFSVAIRIGILCINYLLFLILFHSGPFFQREPGT